MAFLGKTYHLVKHENFDGFLREVAKLPEEEVQKHLQHKMAFKIVKNGDSYTITTHMSDGPRDTSFKSGVEFEENIKGTQLKTCYVVDGNIVNKTVKHPNGFDNFKKIFNGDDSVVEITSSVWDGTAKTYYKA